MGILIENAGRGGSWGKGSDGIGISIARVGKGGRVGNGIENGGICKEITGNAGNRRDGSCRVGRLGMSIVKTGRAGN
jgi:hypothetical protein